MSDHSTYKGPFEAYTYYHLNTPFHGIHDARYPYARHQTFATREEADAEAARLNARWWEVKVAKAREEDRARLREIRRSTELGRMHDELAQGRRRCSCGHPDPYHC